MAYNTKLGFHKQQQSLQASLALDLEPGIQSQWYPILSRVLSTQFPPGSALFWDSVRSIDALHASLETNFQLVIVLQKHAYLNILKISPPKKLKIFR